jgi:hypothetical protein
LCLVSSEILKEGHTRGKEHRWYIDWFLNYSPKKGTRNLRRSNFINKEENKQDNCGTFYTIIM